MQGALDLVTEQRPDRLPAAHAIGQAQRLANSLRTEVHSERCVAAEIGTAVGHPRSAQHPSRGCLGH